MAIGADQKLSAKGKALFDDTFPVRHDIAERGSFEFLDGCEDRVARVLQGIKTMIPFDRFAAAFQPIFENLFEITLWQHEHEWEFRRECSERRFHFSIRAVVKRDRSDSTATLNQCLAQPQTIQQLKGRRV